MHMELKEMRIGLVYTIAIALIIVTEIVTNIYFPVKPATDRVTTGEIFENLKTSLIQADLKYNESGMVHFCRDGKSIVLHQKNLADTLQTGDRYGACHQYSLR